MFVLWLSVVDVQVFGDKLTTVLIGMVAVSVTLFALSGPALVTLREYVIFAPGPTVLGALIVTPKSAPPESA